MSLFVKCCLVFCKFINRHIIHVFCQVLCKFIDQCNTHVFCQVFWKKIINHCIHVFCQVLCKFMNQCNIHMFCQVFRKYLWTNAWCTCSAKCSEKKNYRPLHSRVLPSVLQIYQPMHHPRVLPSVLQIYQPMQYPRVLKLCVVSHFSPLHITSPHSAKVRKGSVLSEDVLNLRVHLGLLEVNGKVWTVGGMTLTGANRSPREKKNMSRCHFIYRNFTWIGAGLNPVLWGGERANYHPCIL